MAGAQSLRNPGSITTVNIWICENDHFRLTLNSFSEITLQEEHRVVTGLQIVVFIMAV